MERRACAPGSFWDSLLKHCISSEPVGLRPSSAITDVPVAIVKQVLSSGGPVEPRPAVSPSVWICVGLVMSASLLVLLFWFIIYKHHHRTSHNTGNEDAHTAVSSQQEEDSKLQEVPIAEETCGRSLCNGWAEHSLPLPATELGDSALVTTKTGQAVEV
ncbi:tumor necrosis factor receptor superfamily member 17-like isoform X2 [Triplophysa rosa]|uniref:Tumor necrosis factor receptor superfamily member 17-like n=1 Tax=Triplophysa rosa TaxID=992332 RepID=A0A9W7WSH9_TRIRA|nr:tumor necrosis factor receptor superfamily member 17-like isoform X2 [Triplophysa rosa]KAI7807455.1 putative tumor necrosis factor receptor superfamily member 17-like [Triplophysa rosa]